MKVKFFATYRDITRRMEDYVTAAPDIWALLLMLGDRYGEVFRNAAFSPEGMEISEEAIILVNGRDICHLQGKDTPLDESDTVSIFPAVAGG